MLNNWPIFSHDISVDLNVHMAVNYHTITYGIGTLFKHIRTLPMG